jgi:phage-related protein
MSEEFMEFDTKVENLENVLRIPRTIEGDCCGKYVFAVDVSNRTIHLLKQSIIFIGIVSILVIFIHIVSSVGDWWQGLCTKLENWYDDVRQSIIDACNKVAAFFVEYSEKIYKFFADSFSDIYEFFDRSFNNIYDFFHDSFNDIWNLFSGVVDYITSTFNALTSKVDSIITTVTNFPNTLKKFGEDLYHDIVQSIIDALPF